MFLGGWPNFTFCWRPCLHTISWFWPVVDDYAFAAVVWHRNPNNPLIGNWKLDVGNCHLEIRSCNCLWEIRSCNCLAITQKKESLGNWKGARQQMIELCLRNASPNDVGNGSVDNMEILVCPRGLSES